MRALKIATLLLAMFSGMHRPSLALSQPVIPRHDVQQAFDYACSVMEYDCSQVQPPFIEWGNYYIYGVFGGYDGTATVYMDNTVLRFADEVFIQAILAHEITHYLDVQLGYTELPFTRESVCDTEYRAWRVSNAYVVDHGRPDFAVFDWHVVYGCYQ